METQTVITQKSGVSIALVIIIVSGVIANLTMMLTLRGDVALVQKDVSHVVDTVKDISAAVIHLTDETRSDIQAMRVELAILNSRLDALER